MDNIQYDPERILNGLPEDVLKELAKKLKRRIRLTKNDIIQEILCPPKGKPEARVKVWQEINRQLRKELETFSEEVSTMFSPADVPIEERFKVGYMFTLSSNPEIRALGEELYCQAEQKNEQEKEDSVAFVAHITATTEAKEEKESIEVREAKEIVEARATEESIEARATEEVVEARATEESIEARATEEVVEARATEEVVEARATEEVVEARAIEEMVEARVTEEMVEARTTEEIVEARVTEEIVEARATEEMVEARTTEEVVEARVTEEMIEPRATEETIRTRDTEAMTEAREAEEMIEAREAEEKSVVTSTLRIPSEEQITEETEELQKRIKTLENKLRKAIEEGLRTKGQLEKLKIEMVALKSQWVREKEETGKYRNRVKELEEERLEKEKELDTLKQKLEQRKTLAPQKTKEQPLRRELQKVKGESGGEIDLALYQGRKALIFAERDNDVDIRLNALGIIPIWAMEIDWKRPRRRMSTCEIVLYKMNDKKLKKLDEIRDIARYWNIPCNELLNI
ncbi:hypothetical protein [Desulfosporosinus sp. BG]|uniref:hypothetical protein n=1 Tax=Desulfosporosinus sp. BG TaxID=1633135 RepID=UPI00083AA4C2|nr:hypothetical protein [Desulfosporosinus sp. BG]ODA40627.1 hypothetical protein DSBG_2622 [Desulfosporosinus sp. BG]